MDYIRYCPIFFPRSKVVQSDFSILSTFSGYLGCISGWFGSQMMDLGCQDTDWVGGNDKHILDAILWQDWLILATLSMDNGKCGYLNCNSG